MRRLHRHVIWFGHTLGTEEDAWLVSPSSERLSRKVKTRGGWSVIFDRIAAGETLASIAKDYGCSRSWLSRLLNEDEQRKALLQVAKREGAGAHAEEALRIVDEAPVDRDALQKARLQVEHRRWMAGVYDREQFGEPVPGLELTVNYQTLHLDALRHRITEAPRSSPQLRPGDSAADDDDGGARAVLEGV